MGVFGFLKKEKKKFPEFPRLPPKIPQLPRYESPLKELQKPEPIPMKPALKLPPMTIPEKPVIREEPIMREEPLVREPVRAKEPIFVKLSKYRAAISLIKEINIKLQESERILARLTEVKQKEDAEIARWQEEITSIKSKLMEVDKNLFEA